MSRRTIEDEINKKPGYLLRHPAFVRFSHWLGAVLLTIVILSGMYMSDPFFGTVVPYRLVRFTHLVANGILAALILARIYYAVVTGDIKNFFMRKGDFKRVVHLLKYYFFLAKEKPDNPQKYNVGQRLFYTSWVFAWLFQGFTGMALTHEAKYAFISRIFGGLETTRLLHYLVTIYFAITVLIHVYAVLTSNPAKIQSIFTGYIRVKDDELE